ncbi:UPF0561 protein C2orf68 homolog isoform X2 [Chlorocebus sabaeus]|uniref:UPF0561 protein C2orf68 homolog isoform X2 n=1 Tax=Chlorocebus sabaeus TaxID=60711 RepID=UPI0018B07BC0|nr:UPF0561 protein C2orf68 homolog isoform X2 [Chlorocebus sabaeus]
MEAGPHPRPGHCCKPGGRLDMNHGFVHHIRRNQIARDDYDKKVKQAAKEKVRRRHTPAPTRPRKPDLQVYLPRHRGLCRPGWSAMVRSRLTAALASRVPGTPGVCHHTQMSLPTHATQTMRSPVKAAVVEALSWSLLAISSSA